MYELFTESREVSCKFAQFGRRAGHIMTINNLLGTELFKKDKNAEEKEKSRIMRILKSRDY